MVAEVGIPKVLEVPILPVIPNHDTHTVEVEAGVDSLFLVMWQGFTVIKWRMM
jgi:hypothetical protein